MCIEVNGVPHQVQAHTLQQVLAELGHAAAPVATAVNGSFVAAANRAQIALQPGDRIEVLSPMQGG
ncbi:MAG: sulfur carrier protein ThiS [Cypionkella sp.]|nr:sulfur carrier protein ThiS [Cypionkella sp.]MDZ4310497.1 sulfur carrier protein ThiS [Cypionkella sp.]MDZ4392170.1 sulfur carrier protein ThiS [Cypionkella sp.]